MGNERWSEKEIEIEKSFTIAKNEVCIKCKESVIGERGFVLVKTASKKRAYRFFVTMRRFPICMDCWKNINKMINEDVRDGKAIMEKRIKKTIIKNLKKK